MYYVSVYGREVIYGVCMTVYLVWNGVGDVLCLCVVCVCCVVVCLCVVSVCLHGDAVSHRVCLCVWCGVCMVVCVWIVWGSCVCVHIPIIIPYREKPLDPYCTYPPSSYTDRPELPSQQLCKHLVSLP